MSVKVRLGDIRIERNITLRQLEELTGICKSTLNNIENGKTDPKISQLEKIAIALDIRIRDLIVTKYL